MIISKTFQCSPISKDLIKFRKNLAHFIIGILFKSTEVILEPERLRSPVYLEEGLDVRT